MVGESIPATDAPATPEDAPERVFRGDWQLLVHRLSLVAAALFLAATAALIVRYFWLHSTILPAETDDALVAILLSVALFAMSISVALLRPERGVVRRLVLVSAVWSLTLLLTLTLVWTLIDTSTRDHIGIGTAVADQAAVDAILASHQSPDRPPSFQIPTGVLIQSVSFVDSSNVQVSGFVWQKYSPTLPADVRQGIVLPDAVVEAYRAQEAYRFTAPDGTTVVGWYVYATLRQSFDYHRYPFDRQDVILRLWHVDFDRRLVLVPDFASYPDLASTATPGLSQRLVHTGWLPEHSGFSFDESDENTTFGYEPDQAIGAYPELFFNIGLKREFLGPFFDYINFAIVVALLLFAVVALTAREEETRSRFGISTFGVLGSAGTLLFAVLLKHSQLRTAIAADQIAYLEVLPSLLYLGILLASLNAILLALPVRLAWLQYRNNILPDLLYWPLLLGILLTITIIVFY